jgi:hypothetical protein
MRKSIVHARDTTTGVAKTGTIGWSATTVPAATAARYRAELRRLDAALVAYRHAESGRVSATVLAMGPITCGICGADLT